MFWEVLHVEMAVNFLRAPELMKDVVCIYYCVDFSQFIFQQSSVYKRRKMTNPYMSVSCANGIWTSKFGFIRKKLDSKAFATLLPPPPPHLLKWSAVLSGIVICIVRYFVGGFVLYYDKKPKQKKTHAHTPQIFVNRSQALPPPRMPEPACGNFHFLPSPPSAKSLAPDAGNSFRG